MGTVVVDAGVMIAILDAADVHHDAARRAIAESGPDSQFVLPASAYSELMVHPIVDGPAEIALTDDFVNAMPAFVEPIDRRIALEAARLRSRFGRRLRLPDALVIATAAVLNADVLLTTDRGWPDTGVRTRVLASR